MASGPPGQSATRDWRILFDDDFSSHVKKEGQPGHVLSTLFSLQMPGRKRRRDRMDLDRRSILAGGTSLRRHGMLALHSRNGRPRNRSGAAPLHPFPARTNFPSRKRVGSIGGRARHPSTRRLPRPPTAARHKVAARSARRRSTTCRGTGWPTSWRWKTPRSGGRQLVR
jgi:hypothetical protein